MAMEVLAAEFPDIFTQYIEIVPEVVPEVVNVTEDVKTGPVTSKTIEDIFLEHDYGQKAFVQEDANKNFSKTDFENTVFSNDVRRDELLELPQNENDVEFDHLISQRGGQPCDELDKILEDLRLSDEDSNSNILFSLEQEKSSLGCNWTSEYSSCDHGPCCPFTCKVLDLAPAGVNSLVVLRSTPAGYVKVPVSLGQQDLLRLTNLTAQDQVRRLAFNMAPVRQTVSLMSVSSSEVTSQDSRLTSNLVTSLDSRLTDITNQKLSSYRPPANAVLIKVPDTSSPGSLCSQCSSSFSDNKSLVKHTRNQHQVYQCSKCGESTVGYYRMASHAKKNHSKEPSLYCPCGRTFSEKRGLAKHQNSCVQFKNS